MKRLVIALVVLSLLLVGCPASTSTSEPSEDITWISPGKVMVANFYPGARAEYPLTIRNGNNSTSTFEVKYRYPNNVEEEYAFPLEEAQDWVIIADPTPVLMPKETRDILIAIEMPEGAVNPASKWEFWVSVIDTTQTGTVRTELCSRWLVTMRR